MGKKEKKINNQKKVKQLPMKISLKADYAR